MSPRSTLALPLAAMLLATAIVPSASSLAADPPKELLVFFGTYTSGGKSKGIYVNRLELATGKLTAVGAIEGVTNPSFLALHPSGGFLYAVSEVSNSDGKKTGAVSSFAIERATGALVPLNHQSSEGAGPCHVSVDRKGLCVLVANYGSGSVACLPIREDGSLGPAGSAIQHEGSSIDPRRQKGPHAHSINVSPDNRFAFAADLGLDKILIYRLEPQAAKLTPNDVPFAATPQGGGPRHFAFHPSGEYAYVCNEMKSSVTALRYDGATGGLSQMQTINTLPAGFSENNSTAEIQVHPSGKFLYCSNRGHDSLAIFSIDEKTGKLTESGHQKTLGRTPRNFGIDPTGTYLIACNQASDNVAVFSIDPKTGQLGQVGEPSEIPSPVCVKFLAVE